MSELADELAFDRLVGVLANEARDPPSPQQVAEVLRRALGRATLRARVLATLQLEALPWLRRFSSVARARGAAPSAATYRALWSTSMREARVAFGADWRALAAWASGVEASPLPALPSPAALPGGESAFAGDFTARAAAIVATVAPRHASRVDLVVTPSRPSTARCGARVRLSVRHSPETPLGAFELAHELGHAVAALVTGEALPRSLDEAVAAWMARHLEDDAGLLGLGAAAHEQRALRARRQAIAAELAAIEEDPARLAETRPVPWALWHDAGAQRAYLGAEQIAERWWRHGLRWDGTSAEAERELAAAIADGLAAARALAPPMPW